MNDSIAIVAVDWSNSLADLAARINAEHQAVETALNDSVRHAIAAGELLIEAKAQHEHGTWIPWLRDHCGITGRTAQRYMRLARNRATIEANTTCVSDLSLNGALALLTVPRGDGHSGALIGLADASLESID